jgi:hypothetical protein
MMRITIRAKNEDELNWRIDELIERNKAVVVKKGMLIGFNKTFQTNEFTGRAKFQECEDTITYIAVLDMPDNRKGAKK